MCGLALVVGAGADLAQLRPLLTALAPRGEREETAVVGVVAAGVQRLPIVDRDRAVQPLRSADGQWLLCYNGEIFNHRQLRAELAALGVVGRTDSDTEVVLAAFRAWGERAVTRLRGEFAIVAVQPATGRCYLARDPLGVKPLYWSRTADRLHLASEVKALVPVGAPIHEVPPGTHGWAAATESPRLSRYPEPTAGAALTDPDQAAEELRKALPDSIRVRVDTDLPVGVVLSGGLDSSLVLWHVKQFHPDCVAFTIGAPGSEDLDYARRLTAELEVPHEVVQLRPRDIGRLAIREAVRVGELTEYGDTINAVVSIPLFRRVREYGLKVVLTGDGSDELFGGYPMYHDVEAAQAVRLFRHKLENLGRTELQRVDRASMSQGVECRVPFLDPVLVDLAERMPLAWKVRDGVEKWVLRRAFAGVLPEYILNRPKNPMSYSSGLHDRARLYKPLFARLHRSYRYDLLEPVRRDFDSVLLRCGNDLDRAVQGLHGDYTLFEHARDLAGALRWNTTLAWRALTGAAGR